MTSATPDDVETTRQFVGFQLDGQEHAVPIEQVQEIVALGEVTRVPHVDASVEGVTNIRGTVIPVIDLRRFFGIDVAEQPGSYAIVVNVGTRKFGCRVDTVTEVLRVSASALRPAPDVLSGDSADVAGLLHLDDRIVVVLDVDVLLSPQRLGAAEATELV